MKAIKPALISLSISIALGLSACATTESTQKTSISPTSTELSYVRTVEGIEEYTLENGLKVLLFQDASQPKTLVNITYRVGSVHENYGETGMAHLLEHMLFKGSTNYPKIDNEFKKRGMATNATTWLDRTNYFEVFDANEDTLEWSLGMEADRMINATFNEEQLQSEMTVVRNEMEKNENSPVRMLMARMSSMAHLWHNYGNSTIGARSDVENFPFEKLREFYKKHYRPDNAVLLVAGRFDSAKTKALIEEKFGKIERPVKPVETLYTVEPTQDGERVVNLRRTGEVPYVGLMYHLPSGLHRDAAAMTVLQEILADYTRGRLQKRIVETEIATMGAAFAFMLKDSSQFIFIAQGEKGQDTTEIETALIKLAEDIKNSPITEAEVKTAKATLAKQSEQAMRNVTDVGMELSEYIAKGDYRHHFYFRDMIETITVEEVQTAAEKYLIQSNRTLGRFIPTKDPVRAELPEVPNLQEELKDYKGKAVQEAGEVYDNTVANIKNRLITEQWQQGTKLNVYPKKLRGGEVIIKMHFPTGTAETLHNQGTSFNYLGGLIKLGNSNYTKEQIASKLDELKSSVGISTGAGFINVNIKTDKENLAETVKFTGELLANPTFPQNELDVIKRGSIANLEANRNDPGTVALNSFREVMYAYPDGHPRAYTSIDDSIAEIDALNSQTMAKLYRQHMNISHGHISVIGDVDSQSVSKMLKASVGGFTNNTSVEPFKTQLNAIEGEVVSNETPDKANAQLYIVNAVDIDKTHPDYIPLRIANAIFGGDPFTSRLGARIRVKEGYSYSVGSGIQAYETPQQALFYAVAIAAPENMEAVIAAYKEEMQKVVENGFTDEELERAVKGFVSDRNRQWASDDMIADLMVTTSKHNRDLAFYDEQIKQVQSLTKEDIKAAFEKYIASQQPNIFKAGDFSKVK